MGSGGRTPRCTRRSTRSGSSSLALKTGISGRNLLSPHLHALAAASLHPARLYHSRVTQSNCQVGQALGEAHDFRGYFGECVLHYFVDVGAHDVAEDQEKEEGGEKAQV